MSIRVKFAWYDLWVGAFIERNHPDSRLVIYVCPLPMILFVFSFAVRSLSAAPAVSVERGQRQPEEPVSGGLLNDEGIPL